MVLMKHSTIDTKLLQSVRSRYTSELNILRPRQNGRHFPNDIFKRSLSDENVRVSINISLNFVPYGSNDKKPALVQIMALPQSGDKPLSWTHGGLVHWLIYAALGLNVLIRSICILRHNDVAYEIRCVWNHLKLNCLWKNCFPTYIKEPIKGLHYSPCVMGMHRWPVVSPHKSNVTHIIMFS